MLLVALRFRVVLVATFLVSASAGSIVQVQAESRNELVFDGCQVRQCSRSLAMVLEPRTSCAFMVFVNVSTCPPDLFLFEEYVVGLVLDKVTGRPIKTITFGQFSKEDNYLALKLLSLPQHLTPGAVMLQTQSFLTSNYVNILSTYVINACTGDIISSYFEEPNPPKRLYGATLSLMDTYPVLGASVDNGYPPFLYLLDPLTGVLLANESPTQLSNSNYLHMTTTLIPSGLLYTVSCFRTSSRSDEMQGAVFRLARNGTGLIAARLDNTTVTVFRFLERPYLIMSSVPATDNQVLITFSRNSRIQVQLWAPLEARAMTPPVLLQEPLIGTPLALQTSPDGALAVLLISQNTSYLVGVIVSTSGDVLSDIFVLDVAENGCLSFTNDPATDYIIFTGITTFLVAWKQCQGNYANYYDRADFVFTTSFSIQRTNSTSNYYNVVRAA